MCSYNKFNTSWACENKALLTGLLKSELDFQGYIVSGKKSCHAMPDISNTWTQIGLLNILLLDLLMRAW
jgi:beta-glucosidase